MRLAHADVLVVSNNICHFFSLGCIHLNKRLIETDDHSLRKDLLEDPFHDEIVFLMSVDTYDELADIFVALL